MWRDLVGWHHLASGAPIADGHGISVLHFGGEVMIWGFDPFAGNGVSHSCEPARNYTGLDPAEMFTHVIESGADMWGPAVEVKDSEVRVAHWFLALVFFLAWSGWLVWRGRRERRISLVMGGEGDDRKMM